MSVIRMHRGFGRRVCLSLFALVVAVMMATGPVYAAVSKTSPSVAESENPYTIEIDTEQPVLKLYRNGQLYRAWHVALGKSQTQTPVGDWQIVDKQKDWGGGFGTRWLGLNVPWGTYGIHGTNQPTSIGRFASHGCVRMKNRDVEQLFDIVPIGTRVVIHGNPLAHLRTLEYGNIGADVRLVQQRLQAEGYYRDDCKGVFDAPTQFALVYFQITHGLPMDGQVTTDDYRALHLIK
ncbi:hypothetical protein AAC03nite_17640 [Alicyclobacillus acidoterrestris]|uniref:L,D-transpeptidase family protein n=1 Tax=Alicyclobacillus suci TaxID=2816080 RepID=UPI00118F4EDF|nr:L,D-transpeptidase family protein [Alicyclobacillus suci]GEO25979.1 hypothetical protein AAC03nite_17640 [Alicyclobacillus acidoterrestris]